MGSYFNKEDIENIGTSLAESSIYIGSSLKNIGSYIYEKVFM